MYSVYDYIFQFSFLNMKRILIVNNDGMSDKQIAIPNFT